MLNSWCQALCIHGPTYSTYRPDLLARPLKMTKKYILKTFKLNEPSIYKTDDEQSQMP